MSDAYNGWSNKPTWRFSLWLNNLEGAVQATVDFIADFRLENEGDFDTRSSWFKALAEDYKNNVVYDELDGYFGWAKDVLVGEVEQINFVEILEPIVDEYFESWEVVKED